MRTKSPSPKAPGERVLKDIRRATRKHYSAEDKIRIVVDGLRGEDSIAELCRRILFGDRASGFRRPLRAVFSYGHKSLMTPMPVFEHVTMARRWRRGPKPFHILIPNNFTGVGSGWNGGMTKIFAAASNGSGPMSVSSLYRLVGTGACEAFTDDFAP